MPEELGPKGMATQEETLPTTPPEEGLVAEKPEGAVPEVDWKARAEKAENDLRSLRGSRRRQEDIALTLQELKAEVNLLRTTNRALQDAVVSGETEGLPAKMAQYESQAGQVQADVAFQRTYAGLWNRLERAVLDRNGEPLLDVEAARAKLGAEAADLTPAQILILGAPELEPARQAWHQAAPQGQQTPIAQRNLDGLAEAVASAHETIRDVQGQRHQQTLAKAKGARAQSLDLTAGKEASGSTEFSGIVTEEQLSDPDFWEKNREKILKAQREGKLTVK